MYDGQFLALTAAVVAGLIIVIFVLPAVIYKIALNGSHEKITFVVDTKERADGNKYIYTDDGRAFIVRDALTRMYFRSNDLYNLLEEGEKYTCTKEGWRNGFLSAHPNLLDCVDSKGNPLETT